MRIKERWQKPYKGVLCYRVSVWKLNLLSREPAVLANHPGELTVSANPGKIRR
jgi:hypothetical protein